MRSLRVLRLRRRVHRLERLSDRCLWFGGKGLGVSAGTRNGLRRSRQNRRIGILYE